MAEADPIVPHVQMEPALASTDLDLDRGAPSVA
jgi:hypothetical protein